MNDDDNDGLERGRSVERTNERAKRGVRGGGSYLNVRSDGWMGIHSFERKPKRSWLELGSREPCVESHTDPWMGLPSSEKASRGDISVGMIAPVF